MLSTDRVPEVVKAIIHRAPVDEGVSGCLATHGIHDSDSAQELLDQELFYIDGSSTPSPLTTDACWQEAQTSSHNGTSVLLFEDGMWYEHLEQLETGTFQVPRHFLVQLGQHAVMPTLVSACLPAEEIVRWIAEVARYTTYHRDDMPGRLGLGHMMGALVPCFRDGDVWKLLHSGEQWEHARGSISQFPMCMDIGFVEG